MCLIKVLEMSLSKYLIALYSPLLWWSEMRKLPARGDEEKRMTQALWRSVRLLRPSDDSSEGSSATRPRLMTVTKLRKAKLWMREDYSMPFHLNYMTPPAAVWRKSWCWFQAEIDLPVSSPTKPFLDFTFPLTHAHFGEDVQLKQQRTCVPW